MKTGETPINRKRVRYTFTLNPQTMERFKMQCGRMPLSQQIEELVEDWLSAHSTPTHFPAGPGVTRGYLDMTPEERAEAERKAKTEGNKSRTK